MSAPLRAARPEKSVIGVTLKLKLRPAQERRLTRWLWHLTAVYNWAVKTVEADARHGIYRSSYTIEALVTGHGKKLGIPTMTMQDTVHTAVNAWKRCFTKLAKRPRLKGKRNRLNSIPSHRDVQIDASGKRLRFPVIGWLKFHQQEIPAGKVKASRLVRRPSGWYAYVCIEAAVEPIPHVLSGHVGIDPGFASLLTLSTGEKVDHPNELSRGSVRLAQAQRGENRRLTARLRERQAARQKDRNHKLSRRLVAENALIAWSKDAHQAIAKTFGKSVASAAHGQLRQMLAYKCRAGGREFIEVPGRYSTVTCSACGARSGPTGYAGLKVRQWTCGCGAEHERDVNAARNTLIAARGLRVERTGDRSSRNCHPMKHGDGHLRAAVDPQEEISA